MNKIPKLIAAGVIALGGYGLWFTSETVIEDSTHRVEQERERLTRDNQVIQTQLEKQFLANHFHNQLNGLIVTYAYYLQEGKSAAAESLLIQTRPLIEQYGRAQAIALEAERLPEYRQAIDAVAHAQDPQGTDVGLYNLLSKAGIIGSITGALYGVHVLARDKRKPGE